jgi:hypothetical protein
MDVMATAIASTFVGQSMENGYGEDRLGAAALDGVCFQGGYGAACGGQHYVTTGAVAAWFLAEMS